MSMNPLRHALSRMGGRDPQELNRTATPLELFFDLTFVIAFGVAGSQFAHELAEARFGSGLIGFTFAMFAVMWAWINFSWFASAYDTDDWVFRVVTMVQMVGVLILAMGIEPMFQSLDEGHRVDNSTMVLGYIIMRLALVFQWLRAAKQDPERRSACLTYAKFLVVAQIGWVVVLIVHADILTNFLMAAPLFLLEMATPTIAERKAKTPWHAHHIAERYGLLAIIALGECLIGAIESLRAIVALHGWSVDAALVGLGGTGLAFGMWWIYFILPAGHALHHQRHRAFAFGYGHMFIFGSIAATGGGLHVAALFIDHAALISATVVVATIAVPVALFKVALSSLYGYLLGFDRALLGVTALVVVLLCGSVGLAALDVSVPVCMMVIVAALALSIVIDERRGAARREAALERLGAHPAT
ncbi:MULTISPECIES: low temperature requirement protein A [Arthrobacter]|uniref:low temperature requirement protein A n=1 Tax=Arthrobacter TaxID=1663 RepID=UPI0025517BD1|nr:MULTISPECIES: low temperature requirement protein A [Arthrobacter]MDQ0239440.1 low temperature requirement protein LtrA [Arthrobacter bambusae]